MLALLGLFPSTANETAIIPHSPPPIRQVQKISLEGRLLEDIQDGKLDMPLLEASLVAAGNDDLMIPEYMGELRKLSEEILRTVEREGYINNLEKAKLIAGEIRDRITDVRGEFNLNTVANPNSPEGNCLSRSILLHHLCSLSGIDSGFTATYDHIFNHINLETGEGIYIDVAGEDFSPGDSLFDPSWENLSIEQVVASVYCYRGFKLGLEKNYDEAINAHLNGLQFDARDISNLINLVEAYRGAKRYGEALHTTDQFMTMYPEMVRPYFEKALTLYEMGEYDGVLDCVGKAERIFGEESGFLLESVKNDALRKLRGDEEIVWED
jgi:tetratricopeptide (TPR) repeat protein